MNRTFLGFVGAAAALAGCATYDEPRVDERAQRILDGLERTGQVSGCIQVSRVEQIKPVTDSKFLVRTGVNQWYLSNMKGRCHGALRNQRRLEYNLSTPQLCSNQIVRVVDNLTGAVQGSCSFDRFERLEKKVDAES